MPIRLLRLIYHFHEKDTSYAHQPFVLHSLSSWRHSSWVSYPSFCNCSSSFAQLHSYHIGSLPGGTNSYGNGVNDSGQVTGYAYSSNGNSHAFLSGTNGSGLINLGVLPGGTYSNGSSINNSGQIVGKADTASGNIHAFITNANGGMLHDLGTLGGNQSSGNGINANGQVTGSANTVNNTAAHAFLSGVNGGTLQDLGTLPGGDVSVGFAVNASGQVTGYSTTVINDPTQHAFLSGPNGVGLMNLGTLPGGSYSEGLGVNVSGQVVGYSQTAYIDPNTGGKEIHAFLSGPNGVGLTDLGTLPSFNESRGLGVNDSGQAVGYVSTGGFAHQDASLFSNGVMTDLNNLIPSNSNFALSEATSISNAGFITGTGTNNMGQAYAFLLTPDNLNPVPEASSLISLGLLVAFGLGTFIVARRKGVKA